jgi:enolase-phosphatase E1
MLSTLLLDIEGTTSSVHFVFEVMFPYVRRELTAYLQQHWSEEACRATCEIIARDAGYSSFTAWCAATHANQLAAQQLLVEREVLRLMDGDVKATGLKQLQGLVWEAGFQSGELQAEVFDDVVPALQRWRELGKAIYIYSSGSIHAQKLFFGHTHQGNLLPWFRGHYDTTIGSKREAASYAKIAADMKRVPREIIFLSDIVAELDAARHAGMATALCLRPGNAPVAAGHGHLEIRSFLELEL